LLGTKGRAAAAALKPPPPGTRASRNPSFSLSLTLTAAELAPSTNFLLGTKGRAAAAALKPPPPGTRASRNPSFSLSLTLTAAELAPSTNFLLGTKGRAAAAALKPPPPGMRASRNPFSLFPFLDHACLEKRRSSCLRDPRSRSPIEAPPSGKARFARSLLLPTFPALQSYR
jgi:hypothetical protein